MGPGTASPEVLLHYAILTSQAVRGGILPKDTPAGTQAAAAGGSRGDGENGEVRCGVAH